MRITSCISALRTAAPKQHGSESLRHALLASLAAAACGLLSGPVAAQPFPNKLIKVVVPVASGGNQDLVTRSVAQKLTEQMGQQVVVENRPGASSIIGTEFVAKSPADGYTLLGISNTFASTPAVIRNVSYDPVKDFVGVSVTSTLPFILIVNPGVQANSVKELIELAKRRPKELTYGSAGVGATQHIAAELFSHQAGINMTHVPYKGAAPTLIDVVGGQISLTFDPINTSIQYVKTGKVRPLAVTTARRSPVFPDLPTIAEAALPGYDFVVFTALMAPANTPRDVVRRLHEEVAKAVRQPDIRNLYLQQGVELTASASPEECNAFIKATAEKYVKIARDANIRAD